MTTQKRKTHRRSRPFLRFAATVALATSACGMPQDPQEIEPDQTSAALTSAPASDQYIVVLKSDGGAARTDAVIRGLDITPKHVYRSALQGFAATLSAAQLDALKKDPSVEHIERDQVMQISATQNMDAAGQPWGLDRIDQRALPLSRTYSNIPTGAGVHAYVLDTGIQTTHPDFGGRARVGFDALGGNGQDCHGHGTHVAGTLGGTVHGVAKAAQLWAVRVCDCNGSCPTSAAIAGMDWVRANHGKPAVANMSFSGPPSVAQETAVTNLISAGVFVTVAAGNAGIDACTVSPARTPTAYTVAASGPSDRHVAQILPFRWTSNSGPCVDGYGPGDDIKSDWIGSTTRLSDGTSMAAPHVAGVAALYKSAYGDESAAVISGWLNDNATQGVIGGSPAGTPNRLVFSPQIGSCTASTPDVFTHVATAANSAANYTTLSGPGTSSSAAKLIVMPNWNPGGAGGVWVNHNIGVAYDVLGRRWSIFNQDRAAMPVGAAFNVRAGDGFTHRATAANTTGHYTDIDSPETNGNPNVHLLVTQNLNQGGLCPAPGCPFNDHPTGVWYNRARGKWSIFNQDLAAMQAGVAFNVRVECAAVHKATAANTTGHFTDFRHPLADNQPFARVFVTPSWNPGGAAGVYDSHPIGAWYNISTRRWSIFNQDFAAMPAGAAFNVFVR